jgi:hypothetical protein
METVQLEINIRLRDTATKATLHPEMATRMLLDSSPIVARLHKMVTVQIWHDKNPFQGNKLALLPMHHTLLPSLQNHQMDSLVTAEIKALQSRYQSHQCRPLMAMIPGHRKLCLNPLVFWTGRDPYQGVCTDHGTLKKSSRAPRAILMILQSLRKSLQVSQMEKASSNT